MRVLRRSGDAYVRYKRERLFPAPCVSQVFFPPPNTLLCLQTMLRIPR